MIADAPDTPSSQMLDLSVAPVLKKPRDTTSGLMRSRAEAEAIVASSPPPAVSSSPAVPDGTYQFPRAEPPAIVTTKPVEAAPVQPTDSERVQSRINRLYGQMKTAQEQSDLLVEQNRQLRDELLRLRNAPQPGPTAQQPTYTFENFGAPQQPPAPDAGYLSRAEAQRLVAETMQAFQQQLNFNNAQIASRAEAEREFATDFQRPGFREAYDTVLARDAALQRDPNGAFKAALLARGMLADTISSGAAPPAADVRKQALSGVGPSIPEGNSQPNSAYAEYRRLFDRARQTGSQTDYAAALLALHKLEGPG